MRPTARLSPTSSPLKFGPGSARKPGPRARARLNLRGRRRGVHRRRRSRDLRGRRAAGGRPTGTAQLRLPPPCWPRTPTSCWWAEPREPSHSVRAWRESPGAGSRRRPGQPRSHPDRRSRTGRGLLRLAGTVAAWLSGAAQPTGGWKSGFRVLRQPGRPGPALGADGLAPWVYWLVLTVMAAAVAACGLVFWRRIVDMRHKTFARPAPTGRRRHRPGCTSRRLHQGTARSWADASPLTRSVHNRQTSATCLAALEARTYGRRWRTRSSCSARPVLARACTS